MAWYISPCLRGIRHCSVCVIDDIQTLPNVIMTSNSKPPVSATGTRSAQGGAGLNHAEDATPAIHDSIVDGVDLFAGLALTDTTPESVTQPSAADAPVSALAGHDVEVGTGVVLDLPTGS